MEPEPDSIVYPVTLILAESRKKQNLRITMLSKISIPFWIVQTSETKSIVLNAAANTRQEFKFSDTKVATEIRRICSSGISQPEEIPSTADKIEKLLEKIDTINITLANLFTPIPISNVGQYIIESEPSARPIRFETRIDSPDALRRTEEFREAAQAAKLRVEAIESIQKVANEKLGGHLKVLENLISVETERWNQRIKTMEERNEQEYANLGKTTDKQLYDLREKKKMELRALTAEFSRSANDLEAFLNEMIENIRTARTQIGQKEDDIEGAVSIYRELSTNLTSNVKKIDGPLRVMDGKSENMLKKFTEIKKETEVRRVSLEASIESQIKDLNKRLIDTKKEMQTKMQDLNDLHSRVKRACEKTQRLIDDRILTLQNEYLSLMAWTLENDSIKRLMPLTHLDIEVIIARYDDGSFQVVTPTLTPQSEITVGMKSKPLSQELDDTIGRSLENWMKVDPAMKNSFEITCKTGNLLLMPESTEILAEGLENLLRRRLIKSEDKERFQTLWNRYSSKCPKCGSNVEIGAKFCQKCGFAFS